jgi:hypothetical protein
MKNYLRGRIHDDANDSGDPAQWARCSTADTAIDVLEPSQYAPDEYREASLVFLRVLLMIDTHMSRIRDARLGWVSVSVALGLTSTRGKTLTQLATEMGVSKQALSRPTAKLLRTTGLDPAFGLKSSEARRNYQNCH